MLGILFKGLQIDSFESMGKADIHVETNWVNVYDQQGEEKIGNR